MVRSNPIFFREFVSTAKSWKTRLLICGYLGVLSALLHLLWPAGGIHSVVTESSREIFSMFFGANLILLLLLVPAFTAGAITQERENGTWPALFSTLLKPFDIMLGKLGSAVLMLLILTLLSLPVAALCSLTGGLDLAVLSRLSLVLFVSAISYGMIGLASSSVCERTSSSILLTYVFILLLAGATWLPSALLSNLLPGLNLIWQAIRSISPFDTLAFLLYPDNYRATMTVADGAMQGMGGAGGGADTFSLLFNPYNLFLFFSALISMFSFSIFYKNIRRPPMHSKVQRGHVYTATSTMIKRKLTFPFYLLDPLKRKKPIGALRNPVFVAEMRSKLFSNPQFVIRSVAAILIISIVLMTLVACQFSEYLKADSVRMAAIVFQIGVVALLAPGVGSSLITEEISAGTFTALRLTTLSPLTLIFGKLKATFFYAMIFIFSGIFVFLAMTFLQIQDVAENLSIFNSVFWSELGKNMGSAEWRVQFWAVYQSLFVWIVILLLTTLTCLCAGLFASSIAKTTSIATAMSYGFTGILCVVTLLPIPLKEKIAHNFAETILSFNPIAAAMQVTSNSFQDYPNLWHQTVGSLLLIIAFFLTASILRVWYLFRKQM